MNGRYGDNFIFAGADGLKVPFTWGEDGTLCYRGVPVDAAVPDVAMSNGAPLTLNDQGQYDPAGTNYLLAGEVKTISVDDYEAAVKAGNAPTVLRDTTGAGQLVMRMEISAQRNAISGAGHLRDHLQGRL